MIPTDEEIEQIMKDLHEKYGDSLPNPEHYPKCFGVLLKHYLYEKGKLT